MPGADEMEIVNALPCPPRELIVITRRHGLYRLDLIESRAERIDSGIPEEKVYPFKREGKTRPIYHHSVSPDGKRIALALPSDVYYSSDGGRRFRRLPLRGIRAFTEILSVAIHPLNPKLLLVGTAAGGIYVSRDGGETAERIRAGMPGEPVTRPNFLEEVRALCFADEDAFYAGMGFGNGVYRGSIAKRVIEPIREPDLFTYPDGDLYRVTSLDYVAGRLFIGTNRSQRKIIPIGGERGNLDPAVREAFLGRQDCVSIRTPGAHLTLHRQYMPPRTRKPNRRAEGRRGLYISYSFTQGDNYPKLISLLRLLGLNAVVINLKDDYGSIRVPSSDPMLTAVPGAVNPYVRVRDTIDRLKSDGIYVIGRQVCFKDDKLYQHKNHRYAVKFIGGAPFQKGPEKWVDGFSEFVWDYNIAAAKAIENAGADEIQFDYIRFPDVRGERDRRFFDFRRDGQLMREALVSFLKKAADSISVPISVDLFGYQAIYQWGEWIGQDITEMAAHVDVVSPMFYPSHYTGGYAAGYGDRRIYYTIYLSCTRAKELAGGAILRPFIQAFYYKDNADGYCVDYIGWELDALRAAGVKDYLFWNDLSEYTILIRGMRKYRGMGGGPLTSEERNAIPRKLPFKDMIEAPPVTGGE